MTAPTSTYAAWRRFPVGPMALGSSPRPRWRAFHTSPVLPHVVQMEPGLAEVHADITTWVTPVG